MRGALLLCQDWTRFQCVEDDADELAFETADCFAAAFSFCLFAFEMGARGGVVAGLGDRDSVERGVELPVATAVEPVALHASWARFEWCDSAVTSELRVGLEAVDRADLGEQLGGGESSATRQLEQRRRCFGGPLFELAVELSDRSRQCAAAGDELASEPHLQLLLLTGEPTADTLQMRRPAKHPERDGKGRIELVQVPTQPLLGTASLVDEIVAVIDEQLQVAEDLLPWPRPAQVGLAQRSPGDGERVDG